MTIVNDKKKRRKKHHRGDVREDGMIFWKRTQGVDRWLTPDKFEQYRAKHANGVKLYVRRNKEARKEYFDKWYSKNRHIHQQLGYAWAKRNREKTYEYQRTSRNKKPDHYKMMSSVQNSRRRAKMLAVDKPLTKDQEKIIRVFYQQAKRLKKRLGIEFHVDHIVPVAKGGLHVPTNLQVLPARINFLKSDRMIFKWSEYQPN
jgi:heme-degrading monooxygenase HmoA